MLYTETDLEESMDKIETINFHEVKEVAGIKFWCYHAGHVLGAAMFMIEIAGVKVLSLSYKLKSSLSNVVINYYCLLCPTTVAGVSHRQVGLRWGGEALA